MIKAITISMIGAGIIGTGSHTLSPDPLKPQAFEITSGAFVLTIQSDGVQVLTAANPDYAVTLRLRNDKSITLRL